MTKKKNEVPSSAIRIRQRIVTFLSLLEALEQRRRVKTTIEAFVKIAEAAKSISAAMIDLRELPKAVTGISHTCLFHPYLNSASRIAIPNLRVANCTQ
jgi:hypothetical protein